MDKEEIKEILNKFPEVKWDRYTKVEDESNFFGWIERKDRHSDFLILSFIDKGLWWYMTSSAEFSKEITKRVGGRHIPCKRVEELFGKKVNCIHLKKPKVKNNNIKE